MTKTLIVNHKSLYRNQYIIQPSCSHFHLFAFY